jgi:RNA polymerase sigma-70 factor (ECF subfamily)
LTDVGEVIARAHREEWVRVVATLARRFRDLDIAEEMAAEAFATAVERWPVDGVPPSAGGWLTTTAYRKAIDRVRREEKHKEAVRSDLTAEAIRLTRLVRDLMPADGEVAGLLALMEARRPARVSASGELVALDEQDRGAWDRELIAEGHALVRARLASGQAPGRYQILAAINAVHTDARDVRDTDWSQVIALNEQRVRLDPSPIVRLNRAIAIAELDGPAVALAEVVGLPLEDYHAFHATHADLLCRLGRLGRSEESRAAYDRAIELAGNTAETAYLIRRRDQLTGP